MPEITLGKGQFTQLGIGWFVGFELGRRLPSNRDDLPGFLDAAIESSYTDLRATNPDLPAERPGSIQALTSLIAPILSGDSDPYRSEYWVAPALVSAVAARQALRDEDAENAAFQMLQLSHAQTMRYFYANLHDLVWRGYQAFEIGELREAVAVWQDHKDNNIEEYWQSLFSKHPLLLTQLVAGPAVILGERVYVGGKELHNAGGKVADFLVANEISGSVALLELKTPCTKLISKTAYRNDVYAPHSEVGGAVTQVLAYRRSLMDDWRKLLASEPSTNAIHPKCYVIAGSYPEASPKGRRESFELYRSALHDVQVITYDELFASAQSLIAILERHGSTPLRP